MVFYITDFSHLLHEFEMTQFDIFVMLKTTHSQKKYIRPNLCEYSMKQMIYSSVQIYASQFSMSNIVPID